MPKKKKSEKVQNRIDSYLTDEEFKWVTESAEKEHRSNSEFVRLLIIKEMKKHG